MTEQEFRDRYEPDEFEHLEIIADDNYIDLYKADLHSESDMSAVVEDDIRLALRYESWEWVRDALNRIEEYPEYFIRDGYLDYTYVSWEEVVEMFESLISSLHEAKYFDEDAEEELLDPEEEEEVSIVTVEDIVTFFAQVD